MDMRINMITDENDKSSVIVSYRGIKFQIQHSNNQPGYEAGLITETGFLHTIRNAETPLMALKAAIYAQIEEQLSIYRVLADYSDQIRLIKNWDYVFKDLEGANNVNTSMD